jgi:hypothetical protein
MQKKEIDIENLIDSAIAKDRASIPVMPNDPDSLLVSQLKMQGVVARDTSAGVVLKSGLLKMLAGFLVLSAVAIFSYRLFLGSSDPVTVGQSNTIVTTHDSDKKNNTVIEDNTSKQNQVNLELRSNVKSVKQPVEIKESNSSIPDNHLFHPEDLILPPSKIINKDSVKISLKRE